MIAAGDGEESLEEFHDLVVGRDESCAKGACARPPSPRSALFSLDMYQWKSPSCIEPQSPAVGLRLILERPQCGRCGSTRVELLLRMLEGKVLAAHRVDKLLHGTPLTVPFSGTFRGHLF